MVALTRISAFAFSILNLLPFNRRNYLVDSIKDKLVCAQVDL